MPENKPLEKNEQSKSVENKENLDSDKNRNGDSFSGITSFAKITASLGITGAVVLHLTGHIGHENYLKYFGIDSGLFPQDAFATQVTGYYTIFDRVSIIAKAFLEHYLALIIAGLAIGAYIGILMLISNSERAARMRERAKQKSSAYKSLAATVLGTVVVIVAMPIIILVLAVIFGIPGLLAEGYAKATYDKDLAAYQKGCSPPEKGYVCTEIRKDKKIIAQGFLIDSSPTHIAIFDIALGKARVIDREKTEMIGNPSIALKKSKKN